jgi:N-acyl-L-homoserine lactone synthetase
MQHIGAMDATQADALESRTKSRNRWTARQTGCILRAKRTGFASARLGTQLKIGNRMIVTALLAPVDHRRKILLLSIFAFIALC